MRFVAGVVLSVMGVVLLTMLDALGLDSVVVYSLAIGYGMFAPRALDSAIKAWNCPLRTKE